MQKLSLKEIAKVRREYFSYAKIVCGVLPPWINLDFKWPSEKMVFALYAIKTNCQVFHLYQTTHLHIVIRKNMALK